MPADYSDVSADHSDAAPDRVVRHFGEVVGRFTVVACHFLPVGSRIGAVGCRFVVVGWHFLDAVVQFSVVDGRIGPVGGNAHAVGVLLKRLVYHFFPVIASSSMKKIFTTLALAAIAAPSFAQITLTAADVPVAGDTLRYSRVFPLGAGINTAVTGANQAWNFSSLTPIAQGVDTYKTALQVNPVYALSIPATAYGYKVADTVSGPQGVQIRDVYAFFNKKNNPSRYVAEGGALVVSNIPTAAAYSDEDEYFFFPLEYGDVDSSTYFLNYSLSPFGSLKQTGYRKTTVDGWGTIVTPYTSAPVQVLRLRTVVRGEDTATVFGQTIPVPRRVVEYRWMALGQHYPLLFVTANNATGTEVITDIRYRDVYRQVTSVGSTPAVATFSVYPNPAADAVTIAPPASFISYTVEVYNVAGALVFSGENSTSIHTSGLASGQYVVVLRSGSGMALARFQK